jgi:hypothetical protein
MYVIKHRTTGQVMPSGNTPQDGIDWSATMPEYQVSLLPDGLRAVSAWINAMERVEDVPERPDPEDATRTLPASHREVPAGNTLNLAPDGSVLLCDREGAVVTTLPAVFIQ